MTAMEVVHSKTPDEIDELVKIMQPKLQNIADWPFTHRAKLIKPMLSFDGSACAVSWIPAGWPTNITAESNHDYSYTYHHLRRDLFNVSKDSGVVVESRYSLPSAHITIGRYITLIDHIPSKHEVPAIKKDRLTILSDSSQADLQSQISDTKLRNDQMEKWVKALEEINKWLENYTGPGADWIVGEERGMEIRTGRLWYGGGETAAFGKGS